MKPIIKSNRFKRDFKRVLKRGLDPVKLEHVLEALVNGVPLPRRYRPHQLVGDYLGYWECHIEPDWLLIYDVTDDYVELAATGSHADLFK